MSIGSQLLAAIDNGSSYHHDALTSGPAAGIFDQILPLRDLDDAMLADVATLLVTCRCNGRWLAERREVFTRFLSRGGYLIVMGETRPDLWLAGIGFDLRETNFWWWLESEASLGIRVANHDHPLLAGMSDKDLTWHEHGVLTGPASLQTLVVNREDKPVMVEGAYGGGRLFITTLDPFYHHGSWFMPATTRFLKKFLPNLRASHDANHKQPA